MLAPGPFTKCTLRGYIPISACHVATGSRRSTGAIPKQCDCHRLDLRLEVGFTVIGVKFTIHSLITGKELLIVMPAHFPFPRFQIFQFPRSQTFPFPRSRQMSSRSSILPRIATNCNPTHYDTATIGSRRRE